MISPLLRPHLWQTGKYIRVLEEAFINYFDASHAVSFGSGRSAFHQILKSWEIGVGDEVIIPAYTFIAVPNAVLWTGATPVYADVEEDSFNLDHRILEHLITGKTKAIVVQHTFGQAVNLQEILPWAKRHGIKVVENCAHSLGARYRGELLGTFGDAAFFSLGRGKPLNSIGGGIAITSDPHLGRGLETAQKRLSFPPRWITIKSFFFTKPLISTSELRGGTPVNFPSRLPNMWALLAYQRFAQIDKLNQHHREIAGYYLRKLDEISVVKLPRIEEGAEPTFLRFAIRVPDPERLTREAKQHNISLGNWYNAVPYPKEVDQEAVGYKPGSCPVAEKVASQTVNLPTSTPLVKAKKVVKVVKEHYGD